MTNPLVTGLITGVPFHHVSVSISFPDRPSITFGRLIVAVQLTNEQETIVLTKGKESSLQTSTLVVIRTCELSNTWKLSPRRALRTWLLLYCLASASTVPARSYSNGPLELMVLVPSIHTDICTEVIQNSPSPSLRVRVRTQATVSFPLTAISGWNPHV